MQKINQNRIRTLLVPGAFFFVALITISIPLMAEEIFLTPPGMRPVKDPTLVIPAGYRYSNNLIELPAYRSVSGNPANGWVGKFVHTRRFVSNQSAWIYFRELDLQRSIKINNEASGQSFRFWPVGTTMIIESYRGNALNKKSDDLIEIAVMSKILRDRDPSIQAFYPVNWTYARFNPDGKSSITSAKVRECHQCHSIAFHFSGDLIFSKFP